MPRETIDATRRPDLAVDIRWSRDAGTIQVATITRDPVGALTATLAEHGLTLVDATTGDPAGSAQVHDLAQALGGWGVDIENRRDINRLVNVARTARDQAMGKDA